MKTAFTYSLESEHRRIAFSRRTRFLRSRELVLFLQMCTVTPDKRRRTDACHGAVVSPFLHLLPDALGGGDGGPLRVSLSFLQDVLRQVDSVPPGLRQSSMDVSDTLSTSSV